MGSEQHSIHERIERLGEDPEGRHMRGQVLIAEQHSAISSHDCHIPVLELNMTQLNELEASANKGRQVRSVCNETHFGIS